MSGVHQFVPLLHRGDAVGRHTLRLRDLFVARGVASRIYVELVDPETVAETELATEYPEQSEPGDILLYQFATASSMAPWLADRSETLVVNYHNITPPELLAAWDNNVAVGQLRAQGQLRTLAPRTALAIADSAYNRGTCLPRGSPTAWSCRHRQRSGTTSSERLGAWIGGSGGGARWLCVGRVAPNKAIHETVIALMVTRSCRDPDATLLIVGKPAIASYDAALHRYVAEMGLHDAVTFAGHASDATVAAAYAQADVLVVTSEHEGFCVPVTEAMAIGLPVVAYAQGAVAAGGAG